MAELSQVSVRTVRKPEGGQGNISIKDLGQTAQVLGMTLILKPTAFVAPVLFAFFAGLLAEGTAKATQCRTLHIDENDYFTRLRLTALSETIGAVTVRALPEEATRATVPVACASLEKPTATKRPLAC